MIMMYVCHVVVCMSCSCVFGVLVLVGVSEPTRGPFENEKLDQCLVNRRQ